MVSLLMISCSSRQIFEEPDEILAPKEISDLIEIVEPPPEETQQKVAAVPKSSAAIQRPSQPKLGEKKEEKEEKEEKEKTSEKRRVPPLEDQEGFAEGGVSRRPLIDPFEPGDWVRLKVSYFGVHAGFFEFRTLPLVTVNGRKSYKFQMSVRTVRLFEYFYKVDDVATVLVDYENLLPIAFDLNVDESGQKVKINTVFDWKKGLVRFWKSRFTKEKGLKETQLEWEPEPYSQAAFSAPFYMRVFQWRPDKEIAFTVADEGKSIVFRGKWLRKELIKTPKGEIMTNVIQPEFEIDGIFKPTGNSFIWLTDDHRKRIVRLESKIKIGTLHFDLDDWSN